MLLMPKFMPPAGNPILPLSQHYDDDDDDDNNNKNRHHNP
jgi:hypothetical protein